MSKYIVETFYTCSFKIVHKIDELSEKKLSELENRNDGEVQIIDVKLNNRKTRTTDKKEIVKDSQKKSKTENIPGISSASFGRAVGRPVIRGLGDYRVLILENDLGGGDVAASGPDHPHAQNALAIQKLEILKGPAALRFGPFAATGVVNMLSEHKLLDKVKLIYARRTLYYF